MSAAAGGNGHGALLLDERHETLGAGLLPATWGEDRERALALMGLAYASVMDERRQNYALWQKLRQEVTGLIRRRFDSAGLTAPPWNEDALFARVDLPMHSDNPIAHVALVEALLTDYGPRFSEHLAYRLNNDGNIHLELTGPTGMGKSSCAIAIADWIKPIQPAKLEEHLSFDVGELPRKLRTKTAGETVIQDEYVASSGEGARTYQSLFANLEDTLRGSQVNLFVLSPRRQEHGTMQAILELVLWNPERMFSLFLVWLGDHPAGVVAIPWARLDLWEAYSPWKAYNVQRSLSGHFKDTAYLAKAAVRLFEDQRFVDYMIVGVNKPTKKDFQAALGFFHPEMMTVSQAGQLVDFIYTACYGFERLEANFERWWGIIPNAGMKQVAAKCYKE